MASHEVVDDVVSVCRGFIRGGDSSIYDLKLAILNQSSDLGPLQVILSVPPHFEEFHLCIGEGSVLITGQLLHNCGENTVHGTDVKLKVLSLEVIFDGSLPAQICVRMRDNMDILHPFLVIGRVQRLRVDIAKELVISGLRDII